MTKVRDVSIEAEDLPEVLHEICDLIGLEATLRLVEHYGGTHLLVPKHYRDDLPLVRIIGYEAAAKFIGRFAEARPYIAKLEGSIRTLRNIEIAGKYDRGISVVQLAREYELSERQIWNILKDPSTLREPPETKQIGLGF